MCVHMCGCGCGVCTLHWSHLLPVGVAVYTIKVISLYSFIFSEYCFHLPSSTLSSSLLSPHLQFRLLLQSSVSQLLLPLVLPSPGNHYHPVNQMETSQTTPLPTGWKEGQTVKLLWMQQIVCMWLNHSLHTQTTPSKWPPQHQLDVEPLDQK